MKLKIYIHSSVRAKIDDDIEKISQYFSSDFVKQFIDVDFIIDVENTSITKEDALIKLMQPLSGKFDIVMYVYDRSISNVYGLSFNVTSTLRGIYQATSIEDDAVDFTWKSMCHEILHCISFKYLVPNLLDSYYKNEQLYAPDGNFAQQLKLLQPYFKKKYFSDKEIVGLKPELVIMLNKAREIANTPFKITSGYRTPEHNKEVGGVPNSAHIKGLAVDLACTTQTRQAILKGLLTCGIPVFIEDCPKHIHVDLDSSIHSMGWGIISQNG